MFNATTKNSKVVFRLRSPRWNTFIETHVKVQNEKSAVDVFDGVQRSEMKQKNKYSDRFCRSKSYYNNSTLGKHCLKPA